MLSLSYRGYVDELATVFAYSEEYGAVNERVDCVVFAHTDVEAGMMHGAALTFDDVAGFANLAAKEFHTESLAFRLTAVLRTTYTFFMCHFE